jgi:hypothetical protein
MSQPEILRNEPTTAHIVCSAKGVPDSTVDAAADDDDDDDDDDPDGGDDYNDDDDEHDGGDIYNDYDDEHDEHCGSSCAFGPCGRARR